MEAREFTRKIEAMPAERPQTLGTFHRHAWLLANRAWWWVGEVVEEGRDVARGRREYFFGHRCPQ